MRMLGNAVYQSQIIRCYRWCALSWKHLSLCRSFSASARTTSTFSCLLLSKKLTTSHSLWFSLWCCWEINLQSVNVLWGFLFFVLDYYCTLTTKIMHKLNKNYQSQRKNTITKHYNVAIWLNTLWHFNIPKLNQQTSKEFVQAVTSHWNWWATSHLLASVFRCLLVGLGLFCPVDGVLFVQLQHLHLLLDGLHGDCCTSVSWEL